MRCLLCLFSGDPNKSQRLFILIENLNTSTSPLQKNSQRTVRHFVPVTRGVAIARAGQCCSVCCSLCSVLYLSWETLHQNINQESTNAIPSPPPSCSPGWFWLVVFVAAVFCLFCPFQKSRSRTNGIFFLILKCSCSFYTGTVF